MPGRGRNLGQSVSMSSDGTTVAAGTNNNNDNGNVSGNARVYEINSDAKLYAQQQLVK